MAADDTRPDLPAAKVCEHFYASHCYRGMSVRLCMLCHEPDWDDLAGQLAASPAPAPPVPSETATGPARGGWRDLRASVQLPPGALAAAQALRYGEPVDTYTWDYVAEAALLAAAAEAALGRVAELAETWAALATPGASDDVAAEADARCGRVLLDVIHGSSSADVRLSRVIAVAEPWLAPGGPGLFYPAAGQAVLDAIRGASTEEAAGWRERAEAAEAKLAEVRETIAAFFTHHGNSAAFALRSARDLAEGIRQVLDRAPLEAPGTGEQAGRG